MKKNRLILLIKIEHPCEGLKRLANKLRQINEARKAELTHQVEVVGALYKR